MSRIIQAVFLILFAAGCATDDDTGKNPALGLDGWIGVTDRELVLSWGAPDAMYQLADGSRVLTWRSVYTEPEISDGQPATYPVRSMRYECITNIEVGPLGDIRDYALQGNGCPKPAE